MASLWESIARSDGSAAGSLHARGASVALASLANHSALHGKLESYRGRSVVLATHDQLPSAIALVELDGIARRVVLCTPDLTAEAVAGVAATAEADVMLKDEIAQPPVPCRPDRRSSEVTEWILLTSGTTGLPKLVVHSFESLAGALPRQPAATKPMVWSTFYDIRRYGGLQIFLRAIMAGSHLVLSSGGEPVREFLARAGAAGVTHISGTPSHWRRALMSGDTALISPEYVRLSGEVADQTLLDNLRTAYPDARIAHAFASTEAGVAFDVNDGLAGFPAEFVDKPGAIEMRVKDGSLWIRSARNANRYLGAAAASLTSDDGFIDTGDMVELQAGRYYFRGRKGGIINVGGLKIYPEEVEAVINADPRVRMSLVKGRRNPITGSVVVAEVVLADERGGADAQSTEAVKNDLLAACRLALAAHKVPAMLRFVPALEMTAAGKLVRPGA
ncbi:MAG TPA: AMP-binding protein [Steroidobacteraceae bacterium]|nr:AMP-binding protein [Steroidobacteraceae bacterium]